MEHLGVRLATLRSNVEYYGEQHELTIEVTINEILALSRTPDETQNSLAYSKVPGLLSALCIDHKSLILTSPRLSLEHRFGNAANDEYTFMGQQKLKVTDRGLASSHTWKVPGGHVLIEDSFLLGYETTRWSPWFRKGSIRQPICHRRIKLRDPEESSRDLEEVTCVIFLDDEGGITVIPTNGCPPPKFQAMEEDAEKLKTLIAREEGRALRELAVAERESNLRLSLQQFFNRAEGSKSTVDISHISPPCQCFSPAHTVDCPSDELKVGSLSAVDSEVIEDAIKAREESVASRELIVTKRESAVHMAENMVKSREEDMDAREISIAKRQLELHNVEEVIESLESEVASREEDLLSREFANSVHEAEARRAEEDMKDRENVMASRELLLSELESDIHYAQDALVARREYLVSREILIAEREAEVRTAEEVNESREEELDYREEDVTFHEEETTTLEEEVTSREESVTVREENAAARELVILKHDETTANIQLRLKESQQRLDELKLVITEREVLVRNEENAIQDREEKYARLEEDLVSHELRITNHEATLATIENVLAERDQEVNKRERVVAHLESSIRAGQQDLQSQYAAREREFTERKKMAVQERVNADIICKALERNEDIQKDQARRKVAAIEMESGIAAPEKAVATREHYQDFLAEERSEEQTAMNERGQAIVVRAAAFEAQEREQHDLTCELAGQQVSLDAQERALMLREANLIDREQVMVLREDLAKRDKQVMEEQRRQQEFVADAQDRSMLAREARIVEQESEEQSLEVLRANHKLTMDQREKALRAYDSAIAARERDLDIHVKQYARQKAIMNERQRILDTRENTAIQQERDLEIEKDAIVSRDVKVIQKEKMLAIREAVLEAGEKALVSTIQSRTSEHRGQEISDEEAGQIDFRGEGADEERVNGSYGDEDTGDYLSDMISEDSYSVIMTPTPSEGGGEGWTEDDDKGYAQEKDDIRRE